MNAFTSGLTALLLTAALIPAPAGPLAVPCALAAEQAKGGNKALMEAWAARKREVRQKVLDMLDASGKLPQNGSVSFEAVLRPDPANANALEIVIESVTVSPAPAKQGAGEAPRTESIDAAMTPVDITGIVESRPLPAPVSGKVEDNIVITGGKIAP